MYADLSTGLAHCTTCELRENLWFCLTCSFLGCGRRQFGLSGNGHALNHFEESGHGICVKLGTITPEGNAGEAVYSYRRFQWLLAIPRLPLQTDIHCYICNDSKLDPDLASHLSAFGINVETQTKTEKSMTELVSIPLRTRQII
jgi:ubiquitin carboxyl-terminal hydrolase 5/13